MKALNGVLARGRLPPEASASRVATPTEDDLSAWKELDPGTQVLEEGARVPYDKAAEEFYSRPGTARSRRQWVPRRRAAPRRPCSVTAEARVDSARALSNPDAIAPCSSG